MKKSALYAGSFDPFTNGHVDIVERALKLFDSLTLVVAISPHKKPLLEVEERLKILKDLYKNTKQVQVVSWDGLTVEFARKHKINYVIRGLRPTGDFDVEFQMASMNRKLHNDLDTVFFVTSEKHFYVSSSLVKEIWMHRGDVSPFVPEQVLKAMKEKEKSILLSLKKKG
jgi:pantetheine-phosphate adenylyltransferase